VKASIKSISRWRGSEKNMLRKGKPMRKKKRPWGTCPSGRKEKAMKRSERKGGRNPGKKLHIIDKKGS